MQPTSMLCLSFVFTTRNKSWCDWIRQELSVGRHCTQGAPRTQRQRWFVGLSFGQSQKTARTQAVRRNTKEKPRSQSAVTFLSGHVEHFYSPILRSGDGTHDQSVFFPSSAPIRALSRDVDGVRRPLCQPSDHWMFTIRRDLQQQKKTA